MTEAVRRGVFAAGERIPSVRQASLQHGVSIKPVLHAYALLERRGIVETRPQSGYFVRDAVATTAALDEPRLNRQPAALRHRSPPRST